jgi:hypothetical protein
LDPKCPPKVQVLTAWVPACGATARWRWGQVGGSEVTVGVPLKEIWGPKLLPVSSLRFPDAELSHFALRHFPCHDALPSLRPQNNGTK